MDIDKYYKYYFAYTPKKEFMPSIIRNLVCARNYEELVFLLSKHLDEIRKFKRWLF